MRPGERLQVERFPDGTWVTVAESETCSRLDALAFQLVAVAGLADEIRHELLTSAGWVLIGTQNLDGYTLAQGDLFGRVGSGFDQDPSAEEALYGAGSYGGAL